MSLYLVTYFVLLSYFMNNLHADVKKDFIAQMRWNMLKNNVREASVLDKHLLLFNSCNAQGASAVYL